MRCGLKSRRKTLWSEKMGRHNSIIPFLDEKGKIAQLPQKQSRRYAVLAYLAEKFMPGRDYTEREVNAICDDWHTFGDYFILRRELVDFGLLNRENNGSRYWRPPVDPPENKETE